MPYPAWRSIGREGTRTPTDRPRGLSATMRDRSSTPHSEPVHGTRRHDTGGQPPAAARRAVGPMPNSNASYRRSLHRNLTHFRRRLTPRQLEWNTDPGKPKGLPRHRHGRPCCLAPDRIRCYPQSPPRQLWARASPSALARSRRQGLDSERLRQAGTGGCWGKDFMVFLRARTYPRTGIRICQALISSLPPRDFPCRIALGPRPPHSVLPPLPIPSSLYPSSIISSSGKMVRRNLRIECSQRSRSAAWRST